MHGEFFTLICLKDHKPNSSSIVYAAVPDFTLTAVTSHPHRDGHDQFGHKGDFITSPEIFGELLGVLIVAEWMAQSSKNRGVGADRSRA
jgi:hypothetical protein